MKPLLPLGGIPAAIALLSALPTNAPAAIFAQAPFTGDADNGIDPSKAYTHAINYDFTGNVTVNGAVFTGTGAGVAVTVQGHVRQTTVRGDRRGWRHADQEERKAGTDRRSARLLAL